MGTITNPTGSITTPSGDPGTLPAATVPLVGTELMEIYEGGAWKYLTTDNFTAGRVINTGGVNLTGSDIPENGWYLSATDTASLATDGVLRVSVSTTAFASVLPIDISAAGAGQIVFPAVQNPSANANTLDDYKEGTWTPAITFGGASTGITYAASGQTGNYVKIGKLLFLNFRIVLSNKGSATGDAKISGVPYTFNSTNTVGAMSGASFWVVENLAFTANLVGNAESGAATIELGRNVSGAGFALLSDADFANNTVLRGSLVSIVAD